MDNKMKKLIAAKVLIALGRSKLGVTAIDPVKYEIDYIGMDAVLDSLEADDLIEYDPIWKVFPSIEEDVYWVVLKPELRGKR